MWDRQGDLQRQDTRNILYIYAYDKSAVTKYSTGLDHRIKFQDTGQNIRLQVHGLTSHGNGRNKTILT